MERSRQGVGGEGGYGEWVEESRIEYVHVCTCMYLLLPSGKQATLDRLVPRPCFVGRRP